MQGSGEALRAAVALHSKKARRSRAFFFCVVNRL